VNRETAQTLISGWANCHLEIIVDRMLRDSKSMRNVGKPQVAYRDTIKRASEARSQVWSGRPAAMDSSRLSELRNRNRSARQWL